MMMTRDANTMNENKSNMEFVWGLWDTFNRKFLEYWKDNKMKNEDDLKTDSFCAAYEALLEWTITSLISEMKDRDLNVDKILRDTYDKKIWPEMDRILTENIQEVMAGRE